LSKGSRENLLLIGEVIRPHGLDGMLRIRSYAQSENTFLDAGIVFLKSDPLEPQEYKVLSVKPHKNIFLMKLAGLDSLEGAEIYRGANILIRKDSLRRKKEEYFWFELIGLKVYLNSGRYIGILRDIIPTGGNDIYVVREKEAEFLIPALHEVVENIDLENNKMIIHEMEGLFELNEV
jgi:16S rRNA processing protein RimM